MPVWQAPARLMREFFSETTGLLLGLAAGLLFWALVLGISVQRHEPGLWSLRAQRVMACGIDYNGPPWSARGITVWLSCGGREDRAWRLWPPPGW